MTNLKFGVGIPTGTEGLMYPIPFASVRDNIKLAVTAEKLGYDSVWGNDHVSTQHYVSEEFNEAPNYYAPLVTLAAIAENTTTLKVATALLVMPFRNPAMVAKELSTLDQLSNGRLIVGVGIGAYREEFESMFGAAAEGMNRGQMLDESLYLVDRLFKEDRVTYKGKHFELNGTQSYPKPLQRPFPFYIGGNNPNGRLRAAKYGTGWLPAVLTPQEVKAGIEEIKRHCEGISRDYKEIDVAPQLAVYVGKTREEACTKFEQSQLYSHMVSLQKSTLKGQDPRSYRERNLIGTPEEICEQIKQYQEAGVNTFAGLLFAANSLNEFNEQIQIFSQEVIHKI